MGRKLILALVSFAGLALAGCGEKAAKEDMIDAPVAPASLNHEAMSRARGMSDAEIAREKAQDPGRR
jgi:nitrous oxide reductase accessory protein NosL